MTIADPLVRSPETIPPLMPGDRLDAETFLARYEAMPVGVRAELIEGIVYISPPPVAEAHGGSHGSVGYWLFHYKGSTPGVAAVVDTTTILARRSVPQPDAALRIVHGGQTQLDKRGYIVGCPELVVEVANSSEAIDLHAKRRDYDKHGVAEHVAVVIRSARVSWFARNDGWPTGRGPGGRRRPLPLAGVPGPVARPGRVAGAGRATAGAHGGGGRRHAGARGVRHRPGKPAGLNRHDGRRS